ncbi:MAG TPA: hypothetical protein VJ779_19580 [Acetobacteraceae bacterium]|nr:hypothetical protein [Acetobacteraceae bacterium]
MKLLMNTTSPYARIARVALWEMGFPDIEARDYVRFRFPAALWMPKLERLEHLREQVGARASIEQTMPHD